MTVPFPEERPAELPLVLRVLSAIGAIIVALLAFVLSLGAALGAPVGLALVRRSARRKNRQATRVTAFFGAIAAASALGIVIWGTLFALIPRPSQQDLDRAATEARTRSESRMPAWYIKAFPQAAATDSATDAMMRSPGFARAALIMGAVMMGALVGVIGGSLSWCASMLLGFAKGGGGT